MNDFDKKMLVAEKAVKSMDEHDKKHGFLTPLECGTITALHTIESALEASTNTIYDSSFYEAIYMLRQLIIKIKEND